MFKETINNIWARYTEQYVSKKLSLENSKVYKEFFTTQFLFAVQRAENSTKCSN